MMRKWSPNPLHRYRVTYPFGFVARNPERIPLPYDSNAAVEAVIAGVPVFACGYTTLRDYMKRMERKQ